MRTLKREKRAKRAQKAQIRKKHNIHRGGGVHKCTNRNKKFKQTSSKKGLKRHLRQTKTQTVKKVQLAEKSAKGKKWIRCRERQTQQKKKMR